MLPLALPRVHTAATRLGNESPWAKDRVLRGQAELLKSSFGNKKLRLVIAQTIIVQQELHLADTANSASNYFGELSGLAMCFVEKT